MTYCKQSQMDAGGNCKEITEHQRVERKEEHQQELQKLPYNNSQFQHH